MDPTKEGMGRHGTGSGETVDLVRYRVKGARRMGRLNGAYPAGREM